VAVSYKAVCGFGLHMLILSLLLTKEITEPLFSVLQILIIVFLYILKYILRS